MLSRIPMLLCSARPDACRSILRMPPHVRATRAQSKLDDSAPDPQLRLLKAVLSRLPPGADVSRDQLRSMMGLLSSDLCGLPLKQVPGSFDAAVRVLMDADWRTEALQVPMDVAAWLREPAAPPVPSTQRIGEVAGATTWLSNEPERVDELVVATGLMDEPAIGFDLEWTPTMVRGQEVRLALLQVATRRQCLLVRIGQMSRPLPPALSELLAAAAPVKVGRGVAADANRLEREFGCLVGRVDELKGRQSLKDVARSVARLEPPYKTGSALTNWDARELSTEVLQYAAFDAIAAAHVYHVQGGRGAQEPEARRGTEQMREKRKARPRGRRAVQ